MFRLLLHLTLALAILGPARGQLHPAEPARYHRLPPLREQARILDAWRDERVARVPALMRKYNVDAWLVRPSRRTRRRGALTARTHR